MMKNMQRIRESLWFSRLMPFFVLLATVFIFSVTIGSRFINPRNLSLIFNQALITGTVATGAVFIFGTNNVNIAMGASVALVATLSAMVYLATESVFLMIVTSIVAGVILLMLTAVVSTALRVSVMFVSIVMMMLLSAIQQTILGASTLVLPFQMMNSLSQAYFTPIAFVVFFIAAAVIFHFTEVGRSIRFIGSNRTCAEQTGIYLGTYLLWAFFITGIGVGLASLMTIVRTGTISLSTATSLNMDVVLSIVLGGMSIFGGTRSFIYAGILGAITVTILNNGLLMLGVSPMILQMVRGVIFLALIFFGQKRPDRLPSPRI